MSAPQEKIRVDNCYDSHVHWKATGDFSERLSLKDLKTPEDILDLPVPPAGPWVLGYGWNFSGESPGACTKDILDRWCKDHPVALSRADGHSLWVNSKALELSGLSSSSGLLKETERNLVLKTIPAPHRGVITRQLMKAQRLFHEQGITHIRDVHMTERQWESARELEESGILKLAVEAFVFDEALSDLDKIALALKLKSQAGSLRLLRLVGVKFFLDGSLGSETAALSEPYQGSQNRGLLHYSQDELATQIKRCWENGLHVAVHCIGDEASHLSALAAGSVQAQGVNGTLHLEHVQILRDETVELLKKLTVVCHLQPGHWLDDKSWLESKISPALLKKSFPWRRLQEAEIPFFFGSDSPLSKPGFLRIQRALEDATQGGIPKLLGEFHHYVSQPDHSWPANCFTEFEGKSIHSVTFEGESL